LCPLAAATRASASCRCLLYRFRALSEPRTANIVANIASSTRQSASALDSHRFPAPPAAPWREAADVGAGVGRWAGRALAWRGSGGVASGEPEPPATTLDGKAQPW
jgi:hypothetical protein